ncbi:hypothetical protein Q9233_013637 [Columba guinea]|nr:hypothetical protein Q9233_013637 [Columba guinea]
MLITLCYEVNGSCYGTHHTFGIHLAFYLACALGTLITVLRNLLVIAVILQFKAPPTNHQHTSTNLLHLSLTLAPHPPGADHAALQHQSVRKELLHCAIYDPLLYPTKFTVRVACVYTGVRWAVPIVYMSPFLCTKVIAEELGHFLQDMPCVGSCQLLFNKL